MTNDETRRTCWSFGLRVSFGFRVSPFGFPLRADYAALGDEDRIFLREAHGLILLPGFDLLTQSGHRGPHTIASIGARRGRV
jgi:hypothetical protein